MLVVRADTSAAIPQPWVTMSKILLVEDDQSIATPLVEWLQSDGYVVEHCSSGEDALQLLTNFKYDILVLDRGLPGTSGAEVLHKHRLAGGNTPVIFLTGDNTLDSKKQGLNSGADDYITKPFEPEELSARIRAVLRRPPTLIPDLLRIRNVEFDVRTQKVTLDGQPVSLAKREYAVLEFLMRNPNRCFSSQELLAAVWHSDSEGTEDAVRSCFKRLRKKLMSQDGDCVISTIHGAGYTIEA